MVLHKSLWAGLLAAGLIGLLAAPARRQSAGEPGCDGFVSARDFASFEEYVSGTGAVISAMLV